MTNRPYAIGYVRISKETESGLSLAAQRVSLTAAAARLGVELRRTFTDDGVSGALALGHRPGLEAAVGALTRGAILLVAKRDRLGRDSLEVALIERREIERRGARVVSAAGEGTDDASFDGKMMRGIVDIFAERERDLIRARTTAALKAKRARGERAGQVPFGFMLEPGSSQRLQLAPVEQRLIARVRELAALAYPLRRIAADLNTHGWTTRRGTPWRFQYIARMLKASA